MENSSFIASSINPDPFVRGQGFVARLSGSTAEMLSIWLIMMFGKTPFIFDKELVLDFKPIISKEFFLNGTVSGTFLGKTTVTYHNELMIDTFAPEFNIQKYIIDGTEYKELRGEIAHQIRDGLVSQIDVYF